MYFIDESLFKGTINDDSEFFNMITKFINSEKIKESLRIVAKKKLIKYSEKIKESLRLIPERKLVKIV